MKETYTIELTKEIGRAAVYGGVFLGGGGGGSLENGLKAVDEALELGKVKIISIDKLPDNGKIITASAVGSPASKEGYVSLEHCKRVYELYEKVSGEIIQGIITNENGGHSTTNGWILSAITGKPIIDAPCNGRAHPTGAMGSMGLSTKLGYKTWQIAAGGKKETGKNLEIAAYGGLKFTSKLVRESAAQAGGLVTVLRNCVNAGFVKKNAAIGGLRQAIDIGNVFVKNEGKVDKILNKLSEVLEIEVIAKGYVDSCHLKIKGGFDVGNVNIRANEKLVSLTFWNEYMTIESSGQRLATFPDLIATVDADTGKVKTSAQIEEGDNIILIKVPRSNLILGKGMYDIDLFRDVEKIINKPMIKYIF